MKYISFKSSQSLTLSLCLSVGLFWESNGWAQEADSQETGSEESNQTTNDGSATPVGESTSETSIEHSEDDTSAEETIIDTKSENSDGQPDTNEEESETNESESDSSDVIASPLESGEETSEKDGESTETTESTLDISNAESLDTNLTKKQLKWLQPTRGKLPQNPYQHVDFTAYTLEWGEIQAGLNRSSIGILPRTQVGTQVPLWALGIQNFNAKVNALRVGPLDLALTGDYLSLGQSDNDGLNIQYFGVGAYTSFRVVDNWSIHAGGQYAQLNIDGFPDLDALSAPFIRFGGLTEDDISTITNAIEEAVTYTRSERILTAKIATDVRLNRRDSFIIQGNYMQSTNSTPGVEVNVQGYGLDLSSDDISSPLFRYLLIPQETSVNYGASLAYQASFKRAYLRLGVGFSNIPYSWLLQSIDLTWRWGGETKRRANDIEKLWKLNKKLNSQGADGPKK